MKKTVFSVSMILVGIMLYLLCCFVPATAQTDADKKSFDSSKIPTKSDARPTPTPTPPGDTKCYSGSGCLDASFDFDGILSFVPSSGNVTEIAIEDMAVQSDGKIVGAGYVGFSAAPSRLLLVVRLNPDGSLDTTFGDADPLNPFLRRGYVIDDIPGFTNELAKSLVVQPDGKTVVGASVRDEIFNIYWAIVRYDTNGARDATFDGDGFAIINDRTGFPYGMTLQSDGKILVAGGKLLTVVRLNADGTRDSGFGSNGQVLVNPSTTAYGGGATYSVAVQTVGGEERIILAGYSYDATRKNQNLPSKFALMRFLPTGAIDTGFGTGGRTTTSFNNLGDIAFSVKIDSLNRIVAGGQASAGGAAVARYLENGSLDVSFSGDGKVATEVHGFGSSFSGLAIQTDGKIVGFGHAGTGSSQTNFAVIRYNADGSPDAAFGPGTFGPGIVTLNIGSGDNALCGALQPNGGIMIAGHSNVVTAPFARYLP